MQIKLFHFMYDTKKEYKEKKLNKIEGKEPDLIVRLKSIEVTTLLVLYWEYLE